MNIQKWFGIQMIFILTAALGTPLAALSQRLPEDRGEVVIQTKDGMLIKGVIEESTDTEITLKTKYGSELIPLSQINRVNGDRYETGKGIIREIKVELGSEGSATVTYLLPITPSSDLKTANILIEGKVLEIKDLQGHPLNFISKDLSGFSRCTIDLPETLLPGISMKVFQSNAAKLSEGLLNYSHRYIPSADQSLHFSICLPADASVAAATPEPSISTSQMVEWQKSLTRQESTAFELTLQLSGTKP